MYREIILCIFVTIKRNFKTFYNPPNNFPYPSVTFQNHIQKEKICELLNLEEEYKHYLSILEQGQCIIRINSIKEPFLLEAPYIKRDSIEFSKIAEKNQEFLNRKNKFIELNNKIKNVKYKDSDHKIFNLEFILIFRRWLIY